MSRITFKTSFIGEEMFQLALGRGTNELEPLRGPCWQERGCAQPGPLTLFRDCQAVAQYTSAHAEEKQAETKSRDKTSR
eukprot:1103475-Pelagomonas_calceolata.AAC.2